MLELSHTHTLHFVIRLKRFAWEGVEKIENTYDTHRLLQMCQTLFNFQKYLQLRILLIE
jgi:hypothetical protein